MVPFHFRRCLRMQTCWASGVAAQTACHQRTGASDTQNVTCWAFAMPVWATQACSHARACTRSLWQTWSPWYWVLESDCGCADVVPSCRPLKFARPMATPGTAPGTPPQILFSVPLATVSTFSFKFFLCWSFFCHWFVFVESGPPQNFSFHFDLLHLQVGLLAWLGRLHNIMNTTI